MNVLITGGAGFIGSHVTDRLIQEGCRVMVLDDLSTGCVANLSSAISHGSCSLVNGSVLDEKLVMKVVEWSDVVIHLAAVVGVRLSLSNSLQTFATNVLGTEHLLKAAACFGKRTIVASTSEVYGMSETVPFKEDAKTIMGCTASPRWVYSLSKAMDESLSLSYWREQKLPVTVARLFNTIGPRQIGSYGMVVPTFLRQAQAGHPITVFGTLQNRWKELSLSMECALPIS